MKIKERIRNCFQKNTVGAKIYVFMSNIKTNFLKFLPDKIYLSFEYFCTLGRKPDIENPKSFNEKMQWLKIYDRKEKYTILADKYKVREFVEKVCGNRVKLIPLLGVWDNPDEIDFSVLPDSFVLKCNHNSGKGMCICKGKEKLNYKMAVRELKEGLKENYFWAGREWQYKNIKRKVLAEKYMTDDSGEELKDYKVFVFNGKAVYIEVDYNRFTDHHRNFYDIEWNYVPFTTLYPTNPDCQISKPECLTGLIESAELLTKEAGNPPFLRVDFYIIEKEIYFGEITFHHGGGMEPFYPSEYDEKLGALIVLDME